jgi:hypothetical protein
MVSGGTAHLKMELSAVAQQMVRSQQSSGASQGPNPLDYEVSATLIASATRITPTNVISRNKKTRRIETTASEVLDLLSLIRCNGKAEEDIGTWAEAAKARQRGALSP